MNDFGIKPVFGQGYAYAEKREKTGSKDDGLLDELRQAVRNWALQNVAAGTKEKKTWWQKRHERISAAIKEQQRIAKLRRIAQKEHLTPGVSAEELLMNLQGANGIALGARKEVDTMPEGSTAFNLYDLDRENETAVGAWADDGRSLTVYRPRDFDAEHPVYNVRIWDETGGVTETAIDLAKIDPKCCDAISMWAYACYLSASCACSDAQLRFMGVYGNMEGSAVDSEMNWIEAARDVMQMQQDINPKGYLAYKNFLEALEKAAQDGSEETAK